MDTTTKKTSRQLSTPSSKRRLQQAPSKYKSCNLRIHSFLIIVTKNAARQVCQAAFFVIRSGKFPLLINLYFATFSAPFSPFTTYTPFGIFLPQNSPYVIVPSCVPTEENTFTTSSAAICAASSVT